VSIHTDDCDAVGTTKKMLADIYTIVNDKWKAKVVDASFMLGVKRTLVKKPDGEYECTHTMATYAEAMYETFKEDMKSTVRRTPYPPKVDLYKEDAEASENERILEKGYRKAIGMLLWAGRGVYPECMAGLSQLSRVLSCPSEKAWDAAMHMVQWMYQQRHRGIKFSEQGNDEPITMSDASNKPDPMDGLCQYGNVLMFKGGPIGGVSKKLAHVGLSAFHNEYMGMRHGASLTMWVRQLLVEMGCGHYVTKPTLLYGDNKAANLLTTKDFISSGNQYVTQYYHYIKELVHEKHIETRYVNTKDNLADLYTKPVTIQVSESLIQKLTGYDTTWVDLPNTETETLQKEVPFRKKNKILPNK
jgi:hypothetical protein